MKFKDDEWLTDYVNALRFPVRWVKERQKDRNVCRKGYFFSLFLYITDILWYIE